MANIVDFCLRPMHLLTCLYKFTEVFLFNIKKLYDLIHLYTLYIPKHFLNIIFIILRKKIFVTSDILSILKLTHKLCLLFFI